MTSIGERVLPYWGRESYPLKGKSLSPFEVLSEGMEGYFSSRG